MDEIDKGVGYRWSERSAENSVHADLFLWPVCVEAEKLGIGRSNSKPVSPILVIPKC